jgi:hypothetical protein
MSRTGAGLAAVAVAAMLAAGCSNTITKTFTGGPGTSRPATPAAVPHRPASALAAQLQAAGLPVRHVIVYTPSTDPNHEMGRQGGYTSKVAWQDPRAARQDAGDTRGSVGLGGGIEVFPTVTGAQARYQYLRGFQPPFGDGYDLLTGTAILRLSQYLTPAQARAYKAAFRSAVQQP